MGSGFSSCCGKENKPLVNVNCKDNKTFCCIVRRKKEPDNDQLIDILTNRLDFIESELRRQNSKIHEVEIKSIHLRNHSNTL